MSPESAPDLAGHLREEIERLRAHRQRMQDPFTRDAVDQKIVHLEKRLDALLNPKRKDGPEEEEAPLEPPTPKQLLEADGFVRQARVEKMRGNSSAATDLLRRAAQAAPTAPAVLEALADDLVERRQKKEAIVLYKKALKLDPKNVGLERKHAMLVLGGGTAGMSVDEALRADWSAEPGSPDAMASPLGAIFLTLFIPGLGHIALGKTNAGITIMSIWAVCVLWLLLMAKSVGPLLHAIWGHSGHINYVLMIPIVVIAILYVVAFSGMKMPRRSVTRVKSEHPRPPVDLPFD